MNIRMAACQAIAARIGEGIPELVSVSKASADDEEEIVRWPSLRVLPRALDFTPFQEDDIETDDLLEPDFSAMTVADVGEFEGKVEIRIFSKSRTERNRLEDEVIALFAEEPGAPGTLPVQTAPVVLKGRQTLYAAPVGCSLDTAEWQEELVFDKKRFSSLMVDVNFPCLIARAEYPRITSLRLAIAEDLAATAPSEVVQIDENGNLTPSS